MHEVMLVNFCSFSVVFFCTVANTGMLLLNRFVMVCTAGLQCASTDIQPNDHAGFVHHVLARRLL